MTTGEPTVAAARTLRWVRVRLTLTALVMTSLFGAIAWKAWALQIHDGARMRALGRAQYLQSVDVPGPRGSIHDANGVDLAVSVSVDSVCANPREIVDVAHTAERLASALALDVREVEAKLGSDRWFVWLKRRIDPDESRRLRALGKLPGVCVVPEARRFYPGRELAGPVLGFAGLDGAGLDGVELTLDDKLAGAASSLPALRDGRGALVLSGGWQAPPTEGATVTLTLDRFVQFTAERALADAVREHEAKAGVVVVMDPRSGDVLALASWPTYDPNDPAEGRRREARNRAVTDAFEPGSVMKIFSVAAALDAGAVAPTDWIDVAGGRLQIGRKTIRDTHAGRGAISVSAVIQVSSNVGAVRIARRLGKERLDAALRRLGFGAPTHIELPGERSGRVRDPRNWGEIGLATVAFGYGLTVTPLQLAAALCAVANGGTLYPPGIVKRIESASGRVLYQRAPAGRAVLEPSTAQAMTAMMKSVLEKGGTAAGVTVPGFSAAGKTGTAHKVDPRTEHYSPDRYLASFIGFVPADDARLAIVVMIDEPRGEKYFGGVVAAPVFARVAEESLKYLGVAATVPPPAGRPAPAAAAATAPAPAEDAPPLDEEVAAVYAGVDLPPAGPGEDIVVIPDFTGMGVQQALAAARAAGVRVELTGSGRAVRQFPAPGRAVKSITCRVTFDPG